MELQHFVSKFIVSRWKINKNDVIQHYYHPHKNKLIHWSLTPSQVMCWPDLYTIYSSDNSSGISRFLEHDTVSDTEGLMATLLRRLEQSPYSRFIFINNDFHKNLIRRFMRLHFLRHPHYIQRALSKYPNDVFLEGMSLNEFHANGLPLKSNEDIVKYIMGHVAKRGEAFERYGPFAKYIYYTAPDNSRDRFVLGDKLVISRFSKTFENIHYMHGISVFPVSPRSAFLIISNPEVEKLILSISDKRIIHPVNNEIINWSQFAILEPHEQIRSHIQRRFNPSHYFCSNTKTFKLREGFGLLD